MQKKTFLFLAILAGLAACGTTDLERGATGAAIGAVVAEATDNSPVTGAVVGAGVGVISDDLRY